VNDDQAAWGRWTWRSVYTLKRMEGRVGQGAQSQDVQQQQRLQKLRSALQQGDARLFERLGVAARWAELLTRERKES
jgi:hypothetical protein